MINSIKKAQALIAVTTALDDVDCSHQIFSMARHNAEYGTAVNHKIILTD